MSGRLVALALAAGVAAGSVSCGKGASAEKATPLPAGAFKAVWVSNDISAEMQAGKKATVHLVVKNDSPVEWPDRRGPTASGVGAVRLSHRWLVPGTPVATLEGFKHRSELASPVKPGENATIAIDVTAPETPGDYTLQFDLVQEMVAWFGDRGSQRLSVPVRVR